MKNSAPVAELKSQLSRYLSRVKAGHEVLVTERGLPIARLVLGGPTGVGLEPLRDLERQELIRLGTGRLPRGFWALPRVNDAKALVRKAVTEEREDSW
jgi:antitoxin (DNA-binding transcriptional repressor) of toxin-antitoxin stability system